MSPAPAFVFWIGPPMSQSPHGRVWLSQFDTVKVSFPSETTVALWARPLQPLSSIFCEPALPSTSTATGHGEPLGRGVTGVPLLVVGVAVTVGLVPGVIVRPVVGPAVVAVGVGVRPGPPRNASNETSHSSSSSLTMPSTVSSSRN